METYDSAAKVAAGSPLVGLRIGNVEGRVDLRNVRILAPPALYAEICVRSTTQDGRFSAFNAYGIPSNAGAAVLRLEPLTRSYKQELSRYAAGQLAVGAFAAELAGCPAAGALYLPLMRPGAVELVVIANSRSRSASVEVYPVPVDVATPELEPLQQNECRPVGESGRIAFDLECRVQLAEQRAPAEYYLRLVFDDGFAADPYLYRVYLPSEPRNRS
jgi:hypothetical protein